MRQGLSYPPVARSISARVVVTAAKEIITIRMLPSKLVRLFASAEPCLVVNNERHSEQ